MNALVNGTSFPELAEHYGELGWQAVATQWHRQRDGRRAQTPIRGVTGRVPFLDTEQAIARVQGFVLHREGGPECVGRYAKPALRPPPTVVGIDIDHDYGGKTGGDTLVNAEMHLGPLPGTYSCTARGQWSPSRRRWLRKPADLILTDRFFAEFGGNIEIVHTGWRFSWAPPAIHTKGGRIVGPVVWYDPAGNPTGMPHVDCQGEMPSSWVQRGYELMAAEPKQPTISIDPTGRAPITERHADAIVAKLLWNTPPPGKNGTPGLYTLPPVGGQFRSTLYGLASAVARRASARGRTRDEATVEVRELFTEHPNRISPNDDDERWITEGVDNGFATAWVFIPEPDALEAPASSLRYPNEASDEDLDRLLTECTGFTAPGKLGARIAWMRADAGTPGALVAQARQMIHEVIEGFYPATRAAQAIARVYRDAGGRNPDAPRQVLAVALGAILAKAGDR